MVHFFGIFGPGKLARHAGDEAPAKANFFGGLPDPAQGAVPLTRAEQDAWSLNGKAPEPSHASASGDNPGYFFPFSIGADNAGKRTWRFWR
ncbi:hypothetical protein [Devosia chinhatensis]|uniref:Uncharacterized protein n=1 Tax=Devosia chinhatensis TaxID=429727 RepID=A0A0F5FH38_9HYPH|nr:hypothetical protein [Devosia chinhatensis]KKB08098.1 hypothetical protein VE26_16135 [Devosia chinhatensis]